jgi:hypothetical protein
MCEGAMSRMRIHGEALRHEAITAIAICEVCLGRERRGWRARGASDERARVRSSR